MSSNNTFVDLSGISTSNFSNPYQALIAACDDDAAQIQAKYALHRTTRNAQQKALLLSKDFPGVTIDPILLRLHDPSIEPGYTDPRHCLVFWGRPTTALKELTSYIQNELLSVVPNLWLMPPARQHITLLEITHSRTATSISSLAATLLPHARAITNYTHTHRARLLKPLISYDAAALALSFVPAAGEPCSASREGKDKRTAQDDNFTYHHLRHSLHSLCSAAGVPIDSRYVVPSAHITLGRFISAEDTGDADGGKIAALVAKIEALNAWLEDKYWPEANGGVVPEGGEWVVGQERGVDFRRGALWYGGGESLCVGEGF